MKLSADVNACAALLEKGDPDRFAATMAAPVGARAVLFPIYAFNLEVSRAPWAASEPMIAQMRVQWWADVLEEIIEDRPVRRHEVATPLAQVVDAEAARILTQCVEARRRDADREDPADVNALETYLRETSGALMWAVVWALEPGSGEDARARAYALGSAQGLANYLLAVPELRARGRRPVPELSRADFGDLILRHLRPLVRRKGAFSHRPSKPQRIAELAAWRTRRILLRALQKPEAVGEGALADRELLAKASLIWRSIRA